MRQTKYRLLCFFLFSAVLCAAFPVMAQETYKLTVMVSPHMAATPCISEEALAVGETINLYTNANPKFNFLCWTDDKGVTVSEEGVFTYTMPARDVTLTAQFEYDPANPDNPVGPGLEMDKDGYYLLSSAASWKAFAALVENTPDVNARMTADIDLGSDQTMIGFNNPYKGNFDGQGHRLKVAYYTDEADVAPFRHVEGATIERLRVMGSIESTYVSVGGFIATIVESNNVTTIRDCWSSGFLTSGTGGVGNTIGGFVANIFAPLALEDCLFDGEFASKNTIYCGGFVANQWGDLTIRNSLNLGVFPSSTEYYSGTFFRPDQSTGKVDLDNVYYKNPCGTIQGMPVTDEQLANGTVTTLLQNGRLEQRWKQNGRKPILTFFDYNNSVKTLSLSTSQTDITEGDTFQLTLTLGEPATKATIVFLTCEDNSRFSFQRQVVIPSGQQSATVSVTAIDNDEIDGQKDIAFYASAEGFDDGQCLVLLRDNDLPTLSFQLSPTTVSESAGYAALLGVIRRTDNLDKRVTLRLSDDARGLLSYNSQRLVMEKGQAEVQFSIGVTDNQTVEGDRQATVTATVISQQCDCSVTGEGISLLQQTVTITDNDGPALSMQPATTSMLEGSMGNKIVISHNTPSTNDVTVNISSSHDNQLSYNHQLVIPAGQTSATLKVDVKANDTEGDSQVVSFRAESDGYTVGTCWTMVTDQTLPDATVSLRADKGEVEAEQTVSLSIVVHNEGVGILSAETPLQLMFSATGMNTSLTVGKAVLPGDSVVVDYNYLLPSTTGEHYFQATVNGSRKVSELVYVNNISERLPITVLAPFTATAKVDKRTYRQGETITVIGMAVAGSAPARDTDVEVYFVSNGARQTVTAHSDNEGHFSTTWQPLALQSGHFAVGACYPGANSSEKMDAFDVYGLSSSSLYSTCDIGQGDTFVGKIMVRNPGELAQSAMQVELLAQPVGCEFSFDVPTTIAAGGTAEIVFSIKAIDITSGNEWLQLPIAITTAEGARLEYTLYYYVRAQKAKLVASTPHIETRMTLGTPREYPAVVRNVGNGATGRILLSLPPDGMVQTSTPHEMASLEQGDSATIMLRFVSTDEMKLNVPVTGQIGVNCENGDGTAITFQLTPVAETKGKVRVDVIDEYTYNTSAAPHVKDARVTFSYPVTDKVAAEGVTDANGIFEAELPAGYYTVTVEADRHFGPYVNTVIVDPGTTKTEEVFLPYQAVTYSYVVEETGTEDVYSATTKADYNVQVPKPIVIINLPEVDPRTTLSEPFIVPVTISNYGIIHTLNVDILVSAGDSFIVEYLNGNHLDVLDAQSVYELYVKIKPLGNGNTDCLQIYAECNYDNDCDKYSIREYASVQYSYGNCSYSQASGGGYGGGVMINGGGRGSGGIGGGWGPGGGPGGGGSNHYEGSSTNGSVAAQSKFCDGRDAASAEDPEQQSTGICSTIELTFKQRMVLTRQAFRGTLKVTNGHEDNALRDLKVYVEVRRASDQKLATTHEFQIEAETLNGFEGEVALDAGWTLAANATGTATILFIPTKYAAPTDSVDYAFGGSFSYTDPFTGLTVTRQLRAVTLTVRPTPELDLAYFLQRDVYGDNPLTEDVTEPMIPAEFALVINNKGNGDAQNVQMTTEQPEITKNDKGLVIDFSIVSAQVNGEPATPQVYEKNILSDFGTIAAGKQAYAQWWLQSSLMGFFDDYDVTVNHLTSYGNPDLSLVDRADIHELIHGFTPVLNSQFFPPRGFLANDIKDADFLPDIIYFTDATQADVYINYDASITRQADSLYMLTLPSNTEGWYYGYLSDPTNGNLMVSRVVRQSDGAELPVDNVWQTAYILRKHYDPEFNPRLHFVAQLPMGGDSYLLTMKSSQEVGIEDATIASGALRLRVGPLPLGEWMYVTDDAGTELRHVAVYDMRGVCRISTPLQNPAQGIYTGRLPAGIYHVVVNTGRGTVSSKVLKR